jgi:hypothetical protein
MRLKAIAAAALMMTVGCERESADQGTRALLSTREVATTKGTQGPRTWVNVNNMILVDGEFFVLYHHLFTGPDDPGRIVMDIWRVEHSQIVEHWDIVRAIRKDMAHANGMACGKGTIT